MGNTSVTDPTIDIICDLRRFNEDINDIGTVQLLWQEISRQLPGKPVVQERPLTVTLSSGEIDLWIVATSGISLVSADTSFRVVDLLRSPKLLYQCAVCSKYGPLRCTVCEQTGRETRLCSAHAHQIKDELRAYCQQHIPQCECRSGCEQQADFRCRRCHKLFGNHYHRIHPHDKTVDYCQRCYRVLFETCDTVGCRRLGRAKCAFQARGMETPCQKPLCSEHSYQWKIWGPHNRGVTLCEQHKKTLPITDPSDLLFMMLTAKPPYIRRGKRQSLPNPFRLRRIMNRNRAISLTFDQLGHSFSTLERQIVNWDKRAQGNYYYMVKTYFETTDGLAITEAELLTQVRSFYQRVLSWSDAQQITGLEITDRFYKPGQPARYRVQVHLNTSNKGPFIGPKGTIINQLRNQLNLEIDI